MKLDEALLPALPTVMNEAAMTSFQLDQLRNYARQYGLASARAGALAALDEAITRALEWANSRNPDNGGYALRNYAQDIRRLRDTIAKGKSE